MAIVFSSPPELATPNVIQEDSHMKRSAQEHNPEWSHSGKQMLGFQQLLD